MDFTRVIAVLIQGFETLFSFISFETLFSFIGNQDRISNLEKIKTLVHHSNALCSDQYWEGSSLNGVVGTSRVFSCCF